MAVTWDEYGEAHGEPEPWVMFLIILVGNIVGIIGVMLLIVAAACGVERWPRAHKSKHC